MPIQDYIQQAAAIVGLDPSFLGAIQGIENRQRSDGSWPVSSAGAIGPMQVMPGTFAGVARQYGITGGIQDEWSNVLAGAYYLRDQLQQYGTPVLAAAAYNGGPGTANRYRSGGSISTQTTNYMAAINTRYSGTGWADGSTAPARAGTVNGARRIDENDPTGGMWGGPSGTTERGAQVPQRGANTSFPALDNAMTWLGTQAGRFGLGLVGFLVLAAGLAALVFASTRSA